MRTHLDLFSGIGGFALAAQWNGVRTVGFCEREPYAQQVLRERWPEVPIFADIHELDAAKVDANATYWHDVDMAKPKDPRYDSAVSMYQSGLSIQDVAEYFEVSRQAMHTILIRRGAVMRCQRKFGEENHFWRGGFSTGDEMRVGKIVAKAIAKGILIPKPCERCGVAGVFKDGRNAIQAHHCDYNKPLEVIWMCKKCHDQWHKTNNPIRKEVTKRKSPASPWLLTGGFP